MIKLINEHNEAFYEIVKYSLNNINNNFVLIHIDEHHDFATPIIKKQDLDNFHDDETLKSITYSQLRISDYIIPLFHLGVIESSIWLSNNNKEYYFEFVTEEQDVSKDHVMISTRHVVPDGNNYKYMEINCESNIKPFIKEKNIILSIDLDYFSCSDEDGERTVIEITKDEYNNFFNNKYHKCRLNFGSRISCLMNNERYYMIHQHMDGVMEIKERTWEEIQNKFEEIDSFLSRNEINPDLIIICNSIFSGYTPIYQHEKILSRLINIIKRNGVEIND